MAVQVWLGDQSAGALENRGGAGDRDVPGDAGRWRLRYAPEWLAQWRAYPLSPRLPLGSGQGVARGDPRLEAGRSQRDPQDASDELALYLRLLLPGGPAEVGLRQALGLTDEASDATCDSSKGKSMEHMLAILSAAGDDLPGAISLRDIRVHRARRSSRAHDESRTDGLPQRVLPISDMVERLQGPPEQWLPLAPGPGQPVLPWWPTRSGQPLIGVYLDQERWWWTRTPQSASTHLLEAPAPGDAGERLLLNKLFCLRLAARLGLDVAPVDLLRLPMPVLQFQRWDRQRLEDGRVRRFHAVSMAQIFGVPAAIAERAGHCPGADGASADLPLWMQLGGMLAFSPQPLVDRRALIRWWIFQTLTGHQAASPMDLWCHLDRTGLRLAPVMDLWCPAAQPGAVSESASGVASGEAPGSMVPVCTQASDWALVARACGANPRSLAHELRRMCEAAPLEARALAQQLRDSMPEDLMHTLVDVITVAAATQLDSVDDLLHTDHRH